MAHLLILSLLFVTFHGSCQTNSGKTLTGRELAESELSKVIRGNEGHNVINPGAALIKDSITAVAIAEPILFSLYGKQNIVKQKPYEAFHIENYWVINGTIPTGMKGGTFLIIFNDRNAQVLKITHGK